MGSKRIIRHLLSAALVLIPINWAQAADNSPLDAAILTYSRPGQGVVLQANYDEERVLFSLGMHVAPRLSPSGGQLLFNSVEGGRMGVWVMTLTGEEELDEKNDKKRICDGGQADWSPDGTRIVFCRDGGLVERDMASGTESVVSPQDAPALAFPTYVPGGGYACVDDAGSAIYLIAPDGQELDKLCEGEIGGPARCAPDGSLIAYQDGAHVFVIDMTTRQKRQVTVGPGVEGWPIWSADSQSLCYASAATPFDHNWAMYHVALDTPNVISRIEGRLSPNFDWIGPPPEAWTSKTIKGMGLALWHGDTALTADTALDAQQDWSLVAQEDAATALKSGIALENDWFVLAATKAGLCLMSKTDGSAPVALKALKADGSDAGGVTGAALVARDADSIQVTLSFGDAAMTVRVPRTRPMIEVAAAVNITQVAAHTEMDVAIVPDHLSNDLVVEPGIAAADAAIALPKTPLALGCVSAFDALLMFITPADTQRISLINGTEATHLAAMAATLGDAPVTIALLDGAHLWEQAPLEKSTKKRPVRIRGGHEYRLPPGRMWKVRWDMSVPAQWRMVVHDDEAVHARMWDTEQISRFKRKRMPLERIFTEDLPETALMCVWGRDSSTKPSILTPSDILLDVFGPAGYVQALDIAGIRGYRKADTWVPFKEIASRPPDWDPPTAHREGDGFGIMETMGSMFPTGTDGVRTFITHLGEDANNILKGLDIRIGEYDALISEYIAFCESQSDESVQAAGSALKAVLEEGRSSERTDIADIAAAHKRVLGMVGKLDALTLDMMKAMAKMPGQETLAYAVEGLEVYFAASEGRLWRKGVLYHELWYEDTFRAYSRLCQTAQREQQAILAQYREAIKGAADKAAHAIAKHPEFKALGDALRDKAHAMLRNRYYLEDNWCGEEPLADSALLLPLEKAKGHKALRSTGVQGASR